MNTCDYMMQRGRAFVMCKSCRQRLYMATTTTNDTAIRCPACDTINPFFPPVQTYEPCSGRVHEYGGACPLENFGDKFKNKKSNLGVAEHCQESLNSRPSPLEASKSPSSGINRPPRKRALLIGVTYKERKYRLKGTINDVKNMRELLILNFGFKKENILVLTEEEPEPELTPTKRNILISLEWLVEGCQDGDSLVFYFSGHGLRQQDFNGDEIDGFDETICPVDFLEEGMIFDNYLNSAIVWPLCKGVTLHAIVDACHSGTILDLLYVYNRKTKQWDDNRPPSGARKCPKGGLAISIAACEDHQLAIDISALTGKPMGGVMTSILIDLLKKHPGLTYGDLIDMMYEAIDEINKNGCLCTRVLKVIFKCKLLQKPQLSASKPFDVQKKHFML